MVKITRAHYAALYGPTTGDAVRLGDTSLLAEIEHDYAVPGDECLHGGGKTLRDGIGLVAGLDSAAGALDMLVSNAIVIDPVLGVVKGDIGIKEGRLVGVGKAGNPAIMDGVDKNLLCGASTTVRDAEGLIATPGGIDVHVHFDSAQLCEHAIASGIKARATTRPDSTSARMLENQCSRISCSMSPRTKTARQGMAGPCPWHTPTPAAR